MKSRRTLSIMVFAGSLCGCNPGAEVETYEYRAVAAEPRKTVARTGNPADQLIQPLPEGTLPGNIFELQRKTYEIFNESFEFGHSRMGSNLKHGFPEPNDRYLLSGAMLTFPDSEPTRGRWYITNVQLLGVVKNPEGQVYEGAWGSRKSVPTTRPLDDFESKALERIRYGANVEVKMIGDKLQMVGAIRAVSLDCQRCHKREKYTLLGAFTYELKRANW